MPRDGPELQIYEHKIIGKSYLMRNMSYFRTVGSKG